MMMFTSADEDCMLDDMVRMYVPYHIYYGAKNCFNGYIPEKNFLNWGLGVPIHWLSVRLSICPAVQLSGCPAVRLSCCPSVRLSLWPAVRLSGCHVVFYGPIKSFSGLKTLRWKRTLSPTLIKPCLWLSISCPLSFISGVALFDKLNSFLHLGGNWQF
jgi:hypothetical protein